jgi:hypothetical protein
MKTRLFVLALGLLSLTSCYTSQSTTRVPTSDDDIYYSRKQTVTNPTHSDETTPAMNPNPVRPTPQQPIAVNPSQGGNSRFYYDNPTKPNPGQYQDSVVKKDSIHYAANSKFTNQNDGNYDEYDYDYATRINRFYYPYGGFGYYDPFYYPYAYYGFSPFYYGFGWGWGAGFGIGWGWGAGWGYPWYYGGYYGGYHGWYNHGGGYYGVGGGFSAGTNPYSPRRTLMGNSTIGYNGFNANRTLGVSSNRFTSSVPVNSNTNRANFNTSGFSNPNISRGNFIAPSRAGINNSNLGRISSNNSSSRATSFRNPSLSNGNFNYSPNAASRPMATSTNRTNSGARSSYFNSNQRFGGFRPNSQVSRSYSAPNNSRSFSPRPSQSYSAPSRSSFGGGGARSFGGGGGFHGGGGRH